MFKILCYLTYLSQFVTDLADKEKDSNRNIWKMTDKYYCEEQKYIYIHITKPTRIQQ